MLRTSRARRLALTLLAAAACVNLAVAVAISLGDPARGADLQSIRDWCGAWLVGGRSLYTTPGANTDYPPNAIVLLAPLALVPSRWLVPFWITVALALTPVLPGIVMRVAAPRDRRAAALAVPTLACLCWAAPRTLLQFTLLSLTLACVALVVADRRWIAGGVALGLALFKPHIAGPIALWMLVTGRRRSLAVAIAVALGGWAVYDLRIGENPLTTAAAYWRVLGSQYAGADGLVGHFNIRGWARMLTPDPASGDALWIALAALLFAGLCRLAARDRSRPLHAGGMAVPALFGLWSLLVTYHNGNNLLLALPAFAFLWFDDSRRGVAKWLPIAVLQAAMMFDVPVRLADAPVAAWARFAIDQFDRALLLMTLAYVSAIWYRLTAMPQIVARAGPSPP